MVPSNTSHMTMMPKVQSQQTMQSNQDEIEEETSISYTLESPSGRKRSKNRYPQEKLLLLLKKYKSENQTLKQRVERLERDN